ncbi:MAG: HAD-IIIA family hydrolase [Nitrospirae bacterium]|nr:MAG: HAD-IIIA family hydrolase [Nitrospirota bacterium]
MNPRPALLLDRDGTLIEERHYLADPEGVALIPGAAAAIAEANRAGVPVVLVSNQSGIGRGYFTERDLAAVMRRLEALLAAAGARLDAAYHCPHTPEAGCTCRKPRPGLALRAAAELGLDLRRSFVVGDKEADLGLARAVGAGALLVRTGYGREVEAAGAAADAVFDDLAAAIRWALGRILHRREGAGPSGASGQ